MTREQMEALGMSEVAIVAMLEALEAKVKPIREVKRLGHNKTITYSKGYISESEETMELLKVEMQHNRNWELEKSSTLLRAVVGTGKTYTLVKLARELGVKMIITVPNVSTAVSNAREYKSEYFLTQIDDGISCEIGYACEGSSIRDRLEDTDIIFSTLDQMRGLREYPNKEKLKDYLLVIDEAHTLVVNASYKHLAFESLEIIWKEKLFKNAMFCTATPLCLQRDLGVGKAKSILDFNILDVRQKELPFGFDLTIHTLDLEAKRKTDRKLSKADDIVSNAKGKVLMYMNDKKAQEALQRKRGYLYVNADLKHEDLYKAITSEPFQIPQEVEKCLVTTDLFTAGNNIKNVEGEFTDIVVVDDAIPEQLFQIAGRFRKNTHTNIHLICNADDTEERLESERNGIKALYAESKEEFKDVAHNSLLGDKKGYVRGMFTRGLSATDITDSDFGKAYENLKKVTSVTPTAAKYYFEELQKQHPNNVTITIQPIELVEESELTPYKELKEEIAEEIATENEVNFPVVENIYYGAIEMEDKDDRTEFVDFSLEGVNEGTERAVRKLLHGSDNGLFTVPRESFEQVTKFYTDKAFRDESTVRAYQTFIGRKKSEDLSKFEKSLIKVLKSRKKDVKISELGITSHYWKTVLKPTITLIFKHNPTIKVGNEIIEGVQGRGRFRDAYCTDVQTLALERVKGFTVKQTD